MSFNILLALIGFCFVSSITPGPNNIMLLASGVNYGFRRSIPHMFGIGFGFAILLLCVGFGLGEILERSPLVFTLLKFAGGSYLLYLAYQIAVSGPIEAEVGTAKPMSLLSAAAFQWVNPKAWVMAVTAMATYTDKTQFTSSVLIVTLTFFLVNFPSIAAWAGTGTVLRTYLSVPKYLKAFNYTMAALLVISLWPMLR